MTVLKFERRYPHPIDKVWDALTQPERLIAWLGEAQLEPEQGGAIKITWLNTDEDGDSAVYNGRITRFEPPNLLEWEGDIHGRLLWELTADGDDATLLTLTNETPAPDQFRTKVAAGWDIHLDHLATALDGGSIDWPNWYRDHYPDWQEKEARYKSELG